MDSIAVSSIVFASIFAAALAGMAARRFLPEHHLGSDAKEVVRLATGLIGTMAALVLGMLVSSAKSSHDARQTEVAEMSSEVVTIDSLLTAYGAETGEIRAQFRQLVESGVDRIWPKEASLGADLRPRDTGNTLVDQLDLLPAKNGAQVAAKARIAPLMLSLQHTQWLMYLKSQQSSIPVPLLLVVVSWLAAIFVSFGLFAPPNATVVVTLALGALAVSAAIFIIMELYTPFRGVLRISPTPVLEALSQIRH